MKKTVRTNKGGWFSVAVVLILFGGMFLFANKENIKSAFTGAYDIGFGGVDHVLASGKDINVMEIGRAHV